MKRINNLYDKIISLNNLNIADENARKGKSHSYGVLLHDKNRESNILNLHYKLENHIYRTSRYNIFKIYKPKERDIYRLPYFPDRIVHHAIMNVMKPIWTNIFTYDTFACINGRGIHKCADNVRKALKDKEGTRYCLKIDIHKFYPSINHDILKSIIRKKIKDKDLLLLLDEIIDSAPGVPIGNYLSQYFANLYLAYFDHWIKENKHIKYYFRYADDMVFLSDNKDVLHNLLYDIKTYMNNRLKLSLKGNEQIFPVGDNRFNIHCRGIDFVGYVFYHNQILMRKSIKKNFCRKVSRIKKLSFIEYKKCVSSWLGWAKYSNSKNLLSKIIKNEYYESVL